MAAFHTSSRTAMAEIGRLNRLRVVREAPYGLYLDGGSDGEILLPRKQAPEGLAMGDEIEVFLYHDDDVLTATTTPPRALLGQFAALKVVAVTRIGAFLDWGLPKDLLVPISEQKERMQEGRSYIVYINLDDEGRLVASAKIDKFLDKWPVNYQEGREVELLICDRTDLGLKAIINNRHWGVLYQNELFKSVRFGERVKGYIKTIREDGKIDLTLHQPGHEKLGDVADKILEKLAKSGGFLPVHDKSSPETIYKIFGESKKSFKSAIGILYKKRLITIEADGIRLS
jgi:hypothetical protein